MYLDLRKESTTPLNFTRSINLAVSERGLNALRHAEHEGLEDAVLQNSIPMHGRMIHDIDKKENLTENAQLYDVHGRSIQAADRTDLNRRLLDALAKMSNVSMFFNHRLTGADFKEKKAWFEKRPDTKDALPNGQRAPEIEIDFDLLLGADGAHSAVRHHLMKYTRINFAQEYIDTLWCEFRIAPRRNKSNIDDTFALSPSHLHIWPGKYHMFIAIPSLDKSFTCTMFASQGTFEILDDQRDELLSKFFAANFPGVTPDLIPTDELLAQFSRNPHLPLVSIRCRPHHVAGSAVILGDAAHAMVPFYGQGLNAGLEDVRVLFEVLDRHNVWPSRPVPTAELPVGVDRLSTVEARRARALRKYTEQRAPDAAAICDLALQNYREMRADVVSPLYLVRKAAEEALSRWAPWTGWQTQYRRVSFTNQRYSEVVRSVRRQTRVLWFMMMLSTAFGAWLLRWVWRFKRVKLTAQWLATIFQRILSL